MSKQVIWTKIVLEEFVEIGNLTKEEEIVMRTRAAGWTRLEQSQKLQISLSSLDRTIKRLKYKYDAVQKDSMILPVRKSSSEELYLDNN